MYEGSRSNNDACVGLIIFLGHYKISVQQFMLRGDENIQQGAVAVSPVCPHPVSLVE